MPELKVRPAISIFRIVCIILPSFAAAVGSACFYGLFTSMMMMLGMTDKPWFTPLAWFVSPVFGFTVPFYGAWNDSLRIMFRRRSMIILSHVLLAIACILFELCHLQVFSLGGNVASALVGFCLFYISQCPGPTATRSLLYDVLGTGQELLGNSLMTIVGAFGSLIGGLFVAYVPQPFFYSLIVIFVCTFPPMFAGREDWYLKKDDGQATEPVDAVQNETPAVAEVPETPEAQADAAFAKLHPFKKIFYCIFRFLKGGPLSRAALCMFLYGVASYGMMGIMTDFTAKIIYHGSPIPGPPVPGSPYGTFDDYVEGIRMSSYVSMASSVVGVVVSFTIFPILKFFGFRLSMVVANGLGACLNMMYFIPRFDQWTKSMVIFYFCFDDLIANKMLYQIWLRFFAIPFGSVQGAVSMCVPYIVVNESVRTDNGLFIGVITCFWIMGCFVPMISNLILSSTLPEFSGGRHQYQWYTVFFFVYGLIMTISAFFIKHGVLYDAMMAALKKKGDAELGVKEEKESGCQEDQVANDSVNSTPVVSTESPSSPNSAMSPASPALANSRSLLMDLNEGSTDLGGGTYGTNGEREKAAAIRVEDYPYTQDCEEFNRGN